MRKLLMTALAILAVAICAGCGAKGYKHLTHAEAQAMMNSNPDAIILDVRRPDEYVKKHIPCALLVPIEELRKGNFDSLPDKDATIIIYCWTGRRAEDSAEILAENGYTNIYEMGGIFDWTGSVSGTDLD